MKVGDKFVWKTKVGSAQDNWVWTLFVDDLYNARVGLEYTGANGLYACQWVNYEVIPVCFIKVNKDGRLEETSEDTQDWFTQGLYPGQANSPFYTEVCQHQWKIYNSGWTMYEYCTKCDKKKDE